MGDEVIFPAHPRVKSKLTNKVFKNIKVVEPMGYKEFLSNLNNCKYAITDSGGVQEESSFFEVPCITVRDNTERPITCTDGTNKMIGTSYSNILDEVMMIDFNKKNTIKLWDGKSSDRIVQVLKKVILWV